MLVLKVCLSEWKNESRDQRELSVCRELGADIKVVAKGKTEDYGKVESVNGFEVHRLSSRPVNGLPKALNRVLSIFMWAKYVRALKPDIISGHDLSGLAIGWISTFFCRVKPKLVYDSHEFEIGRNVKRNRIQIKFITVVERYLIKKSKFMIVVNDSIADEVTRIHRLDQRPVVVRNIPNQWNVDPAVCDKVRSHFMSEFGIGGGYFLMYHGAIVPGRGIEKCLEILRYDKELYLVVMGDVLSTAYKEKLQKLTEEMGVSNRVLFSSSVPAKELWKYIGAADISMILIEPAVKSYYFALPNKLFEGIQARTPVVGSDLPEIRKIIKSYGVGEICRYDDTKDIYRAVKNIKSSKERQEKIRKNEERAAEILCWETESELLKAAYGRIW